MVAQQQHDAEHSSEAVSRGTLLQLQQPVVLGDKEDRLRPAGPGLPRTHPETQGGAGAWRSLDSCEGSAAGAGLAEHWAPGAGSAAPSWTPLDKMLPLSMPQPPSWGREHCCQSPGKGLGPGVPPTPQLPLLHSSIHSPVWPMVGDDAPSPPGLVRESGITKRQIILTTG